MISNGILGDRKREREMQKRTSRRGGGEIVIITSMKTIIRLPWLLGVVMVTMVTRGCYGYYGYLSRETHANTTAPSIIPA